MIRAIRPNAMAQDDASPLAGWNIAPNIAYTVRLLPDPAACGVLIYDETGATLLATGAALTGIAQPCVLVPQFEAEFGMVDADLGWHLLVTTDGTESQRTIRIGPAVDLPDEIHPVYGTDALALARATAAINAAAHYIDDVTVTCPLGLGAGLGDVASVPVDGVAVIGQVESITWTGTPTGTTEEAVIRRHVAIEPEPFVEIVPPTVADDEAETDADTEASGNVLANDESGLIVVAVNGLAANVGESVAGSSGGVFVVDSDGGWTFDPDGDFADLEGEETADTSVAYHASDGVSEAMATLTVTVSASDVPQMWTPAEITTAAWWDASDGTARVLDGTAISQLTDKSGNSRHATRTGSSRPTLVGSLAVFDGVDDYMTISVPQASPCHVFDVIDTTDSLTGYRAVMNRSVGSAPYPPSLYIGVDTGSYKPCIYWGSSKLIIDTTTRQNLRIQEYRIASGAVGLRSSGGTEQTASHSQTVLSTWIEIGTVNTYSQQGKFKLGERIVVNSALTDANRQKIEGYLAHKWDELLGVTALVDALPSDHPHKSAAPVVE